MIEYYLIVASKIAHYTSFLYKAIENVFSSCIARYNHKNVTGGFKTVTQNQDKVEGLYRFYRNSPNTLECAVYFFVRVGENCRGFHMFCKEEITKHGLWKSIARIAIKGWQLLFEEWELYIDWDKHFFGCMSVGNILKELKVNYGIWLFLYDIMQILDGVVHQPLWICVILHIILSLIQ